MEKEEGFQDLCLLLCNYVLDILSASAYNTQVAFKFYDSILTILRCPWSKVARRERIRSDVRVSKKVAPQSQGRNSE